MLAGGTTPPADETGSLQFSLTYAVGLSRQTFADYSRLPRLTVLTARIHAFAARLLSHTAHPRQFAHLLTIAKKRSHR